MGMLHKELIIDEKYATMCSFMSLVVFLRLCRLAAKPQGSYPTKAGDMYDVI
jgi:hypothetical protein